MCNLLYYTIIINIHKVVVGRNMTCNVTSGVSGRKKICFLTLCSHQLLHMFCLFASWWINKVWGNHFVLTALHSRPWEWKFSVNVHCDACAKPLSWCAPAHCSPPVSSDWSEPWSCRRGVLTVWSRDDDAHYSSILLVCMPPCLAMAGSSVFAVKWRMWDDRAGLPELNITHLLLMNN